ncbi:hypothetical protein niasHT_033094 [Heterodera trifolii]|uniref:Small ribosomal subunit protein eS1 n=1 Tax=Heterodera trifolii TaxID=157864 RepID=A0ABD2J790_9BILA
MAVGKNKKMGKKGAKKKAVDPFTRKEWYDIKAPAMFTHRNVGKTLVNRTQGTRISSDFLKGRVYEVSLGDLNSTHADFRKFRLICEEVQGKICLTNFHGMTFTRDKLCSIVKKWHTLIEANVAVKTTDGFLLRLFCIGFTKRNANQIKKTSYAKTSQVRMIRAKMVEIMQKEVSSGDLKEDVYIRKVKVLKKPKFELGKLLEMHGEGAGTVATITTATGEKIESRPDAYEPPVQQSV